jgi:hypothetical protein
MNDLRNYTIAQQQAKCRPGLTVGKVPAPQTAEFDFGDSRHANRPVVARFPWLI